MTDICERRVVHCPNHKASRYLAAFVADHQVGDGTVHIALGQPIFADRRRLTERPVVATLSLQSTSERYPAYSVSWLPKGDGPSPEFAGTLTVEKCRRDELFRFDPQRPVQGARRGDWCYTWQSDRACTGARRAARDRGLRYGHVRP